jgi:PAS domain S-box-containing protein
LLIIAISAAATEQQIDYLNRQQEISNNIERGASSLNSIAIDYFLYQEDLQLSRWETTLSALSDDLESIRVNEPEQQKLTDNVAGDLQGLRAQFDDVVIYLQNAPRNVSIRVDPAFQFRWSGMALQSQNLAFDASQLSKSINNQAHQLNTANILLILSLVGTLGAFLATVYFVAFRKTLKSIAKLQNGIDTISTGNLNYEIEIEGQNEITQLSYAFNQMTTNLKTVTASKSDLEKEIAERKKAEKELAASEEKYRRLFETSQDGIVARDLQGYMIDCNQAYAKMVGYSREELSSLTWQQVLPEKWHEERERRVKDIMEQGGSSIFEREYKRKDGSIFPASVRTWRLTDEDGKVYGTWSIVRDITELKKTETDLRQAQAKLQEYAMSLERLVEERTRQLRDSERMAAIGQTAGMVGHDIRNPLQAITSDVYLAKSELTSIPDGECKKNAMESLEEIEKNISYINKIVQDLQDYARPITPVSKETNLQTLIEELIRNILIPRPIKVSVEVQKEAVLIIADPEIVRRVLANLVTNAVQAMPEGGKLNIHAAREVNDTVITVQDTGVGIPEEIRSKLFAPLFTTKSKGQGFGLAVVKRMIEAMGGTVTFESEISKGTKFIIHLPQKN